MAIGIKVERAQGVLDMGESKFFGDPTVPSAWDYEDSELFLCQIRLCDIAELDKENKLPHTGYLYVFLDMAQGEHNMRASVRYCEGEPDIVIDDFNECVDGYEEFTKAYTMHFYEVDDSADCTRLFGVPSDSDAGEGALLLQFDPLDSDMGFLSSVDGFLYLFFGESKDDFSKVTLKLQYS